MELAETVMRLRCDLQFAFATKTYVFDEFKGPASPTIRKTGTANLLAGYENPSLQAFANAHNARKFEFAALKTILFASVRNSEPDINCVASNQTRQSDESVFTCVKVTATTLNARNIID